MVITQDDDTIKVGPGPYLPPIHVPEIPLPGNPIPVIVHGAQYAWDDVSDWTKSTWHTVTGWFESATSIGVDEIRNVVDAAMDTVQTAWSSFISELEAWITDAIDAVSLTVTDLGAFTTEIAYLTSDYARWLVDNLAVTVFDAVVGIEGQITGLEHLIYNGLLDVSDALRTWAIDDIYSPLLGEIARVNADIRSDVWNLVGSIGAELQAQIDAERLARAAAIAGALAGVAAITTWIDECGAPMCDTIGPNTDLGKLLKGLKVAAELAALSAFLNMDAADLAAMIHAVTARLAVVVDDVEQFLGPGGETVAGLIAHATADVL